MTVRYMCTVRPHEREFLTPPPRTPSCCGKPMRRMEDDAVEEPARGDSGEGTTTEVETGRAPETVGRQLVQAAWQGDAQVELQEIFSSEATIHDPAAPTPRTGPKGYEQVLSRLRKRFPDAEVHLQDVTVAAGKALLRLTGRAEDLGGGADADPTGRFLSGLEVLEVEDGAVTEWSGALLDEAEIQDFRESFAGPLIDPEHGAYDDARAVWNAMIDRYPVLIARCTGVADVVEAVNFARENDLLVAVRGGGHNVAGTAVCDGGLVVDLSPMNGVHVDRERRTVRAGGGATWNDVDRETQLFGLATPGGNVSETGIAGLTLGGGMGMLRRKHGLTIDNLVSVDIVTPDGEVRTASEDENPELFWGIRGGGGNFGIVTSFEYTLHPVGPDVMVAATMYPLETAREILPQWRDFVEEAPEEVSSQVVFWSVPTHPYFPEEIQGKPVVGLPALHCGPPEEGRKVLQPLRELAEPVVQLGGVMPYTEAQQNFDPFLAGDDMHHYWKSIDLDRFDEEVIDQLVAIAEDRPDDRILLQIWHQGGAMNRAGPTETAYGDRSTKFMLSLDSTWEDPARSEELVAWTRENWDRMHRFSDGGLYLNFSGMGEEGEDLVRAGHGIEEVYDRLVELKDEYDPGNLFRLNSNVQPS